MYENFIAERIAKLRMLKKVSARDMSLSIGQNANYINIIENGKALPSMQAFFYICEYLQITPKEFFEGEKQDPTGSKAVIEDLNKLNPKQIEVIHEVIKLLK